MCCFWHDFYFTLKLHFPLHTHSVWPFQSLDKLKFSKLAPSIVRIRKDRQGEKIIIITAIRCGSLIFHLDFAEVQFVIGRQSNESCSNRKNGNELKFLGAVCDVLLD